MLTYKWHFFDQLSIEQLYEILTLRQDVFILEQNCAYTELDGLDLHSWHLSGRDAKGELLAYLRLTKPGHKYREPAIGRVVTARSVRGTGIGRELMIMGISKAEELYPGEGIRLSAQVYAQGFYESFGFIEIGEPYDDEGIMHVEMVRAQAKQD